MTFRGAFDFLSNFYPAKVEYEGIVYETAETAFQAQKSLVRDERLAFAPLSAAKAKCRGQKVKLRPDWEKVKVGLMERIVRAKFEQHPELASRLISTGEMSLVEGNAWHDVFWGVDVNTGEGENHLGKILMAIRNEMQQSALALSDWTSDFVSTCG